MSKLLTRGGSGRFTSAPLIAALLVGAAACSGDATSPAARVPATRPEHLLSAVAGPHLVSNAVKYNDASKPHATGRSGSAHLEGLALLDPTGITRLILTTGSLDDRAHAPGEIVKAQLKPLNDDGSPQYVSNYNKLSGSGTQAFMLYGLHRGQQVQAQANVRGVDPKRTDVVTITETVKNAPQLEVHVDVPGGGTVGQPVVITGTVSETGGDVGTRADCQLVIDGKVVDTATGIWVDAGDAVTCAFTYTFTDPGTHQVEVRVTYAGGGGTLSTGVTDQATLTVASGFQKHFDATGEDRSVSTLSVFQQWWSKPDGTHHEYSDSSTTTTRSQTLNVTGTLGRDPVFPLVSVSLTMSTGQALWEQESWAALTATDDGTGRLCANRQMPDQGAMFFVCTGNGGSFGYTRYAGTVTYHSVGYSNVFDGTTGTQSVYTWNNLYETRDASSGGQVKPIAGGVTMGLTITDAQGALTFTPTLSFTSYSNWLSDTPRTCTVDTPSWLDGGSMTTCNGGASWETGFRGSASGT